MKKVFLIIFLAAIVTTLCALPIAGAAYAMPAGGFDASSYGSRAAYMVDYDTGTVLLDKNSDERYPIASMVKIMTLLITFEEIDKGNLSLDEKITVSDYASGMGGSQMFLDSGTEYPVADLIKGVTVCSANDAATALGERISGNIDTFVEKMNTYAKELGMNDTLFCNATGLPGSGEQYSTAKDVSIMFRKLLSHDKYYEYSGIWMENYTHPDGRVTEMVNTNKLIRFYKNCDSGKTGYTDAAKHCLSASAKVGDMRIVATVLGAENSKVRFKEMTDMFNYAFANYEVRTIIKKGEAIPDKITVNKAKDEPIELYVDKDVKYFTRKGLATEEFVKVELYDNMTAPISKDTPLGKITVTDKNGNIVSEGQIFSKTDIKKQKFADALEKVLKNWLK